jgi:hypothetical protein
MIPSRAAFDRSRIPVSNERRARRIRARLFMRLVALGVVVLGSVGFSRSAHAFINAGVEVGGFKRDTTKIGVGYGLHAELTLLPFVHVGPYFLHYQLAADDAFVPNDAAFNTLGLRARLVLPLPISTKPYAYIGAGYSTESVGLPLGDRGGHFVEIPVGVGIAFDVLPLLQGSLDFAYRPGTAFGGNLYDAGVPKPTNGFSVMLGIALDL